MKRERALAEAQKFYGDGVAIQNNGFMYNVQVEAEQNALDKLRKFQSSMKKRKSSAERRGA